MFDRLGPATVRFVAPIAALALVVAGSLLAGAPAQAAAFTCAGEPATIIGPQIGSTTYGTEGDDVILTFDRTDYIVAGGGNDLICSGAGNDDINAGDGADIIYAEDGNDEVDSSAGNDWMFGGNGNDKLWGRHYFTDRDNAADGGPGTDECSAVRIAISCERN